MRTVRGIQAGIAIGSAIGNAIATGVGAVVGAVTRGILGAAVSIFGCSTTAKVVLAISRKLSSIITYRLK